jgi:hypothetical protein
MEGSHSAYHIAWNEIREANERFIDWTCRNEQWLFFVNSIGRQFSSGPAG